MIWFSSDLHISHKRILEFGRGQHFASLEEHDEILIGNIQTCVQPDDTLYLLGDILMGEAKGNAKRWLDLIPGQVRFVQGNHDHGASLQAMYDQPNWVSCGLAEWLPKKRIFMCHYPLEVWPEMKRGGIHLHGHSHNNLNTKPGHRRLDVGVDSARALLGAYRPFSWSEIKDIMFKRIDMSAADHHSEQQQGAD